MTDARYSPADLMADFSLEMTGKDIPSLLEAQFSIPQNTQVNVTFLGNEDLEMRVAASKAVHDAGFVPVPHVSARRISSEQQLVVFLERLQAVNATHKVFIVGGDPEKPAGPYEDSVELIRAGVLQNHGVNEVSISGYPEGHPDITEDALWRALDDKAASLKEQGLGGVIITQFGFDTEPVVKWIRAVRDRGIDLPIRIGVPGPAGIKRLIGFARRFGVASSAGIAAKYGFSLTNLLGTAGPDRFVTDLAGKLDGAGLGTVKLHFYTFGGLKATADWAIQFNAGQKSDGQKSDGQKSDGQKLDGQKSGS